MLWVRTFIVAVAAVALTVAFNQRLGTVPPLGKFFNPHSGFWRNAEPEGEIGEFKTTGLHLNEKASVIVSERGIAHIFANNDYDLYFLQGYLTAKDRLWQMEFQTHAAAGRISEIVGNKGVSFDKRQRRMGMVSSAQASLDHISKDEVCLNMLQAYSDGVNTFIKNIDRSDLPFEYRLLDYEPEPWTPLKCALLQKHLTKILTATERDMENTALLELLGHNMFNRLFPEQNRLADPVVPPPYPTRSEGELPSDSSVAFGPLPNIPPRPPKNLGSNNWAVSGSRSTTGLPILANDPHLRLSLPSIWYEIQLNAPGINCYGVSVPGAPGILIGFNENAAFGETNAGLDVKDHYRIEFKDENRNEYRLGQNWEPVKKRIDTIKVRGGVSVHDTILITKYGPVAFEDNGSDIALYWVAHHPSNELRTFYELNRVSDNDGFHNALRHHGSPGQNFIYADNQNNIAIKQRGEFPLRKIGHGKFVMNASDGDSLPEMIPYHHNPEQINPSRGIVSSANQAPTDTTYPYYYTGVFEEFRNRTINDALRADSSVSVEDMMKLQSNNFNLLAAEALPIMLELLDTTLLTNDTMEVLCLKELMDWDYVNDPGLIAPTVFKIWWDELNGLIYDEMNSPYYQQDNYWDDSWKEMISNGQAEIDMKDNKYMYPMATVTIEHLEQDPDNPIFDHHWTTDTRENAQQLVFDALYWTAMKLGDIIKYQLNEPHWGLYKDTRLRHLSRVDALGSPNLFVGGSENAPNAITSTHGPSWRMVVQLGKQGPTAFGVFPGGQSGNPGSSYYLYSLDKWMEGKYHELHLFGSPENAPSEYLHLKLNP